jgi:hypothetical protein
MTRYLILIYGDEAVWGLMTPEELRRCGEGHAAFAAGATIVSSGELESSSTARSLRAGGLTTDGPFVETKEIVGGFYVIEAADLDEAISLARRLPEVAEHHSGVEVRPIRQ